MHGLVGLVAVVVFAATAIVLLPLVMIWCVVSGELAAVFARPAPTERPDDDEEAG